MRNYWQHKGGAASVALHGRRTSGIILNSDSPPLRGSQSESNRLNHTGSVVLGATEVALPVQWVPLCYSRAGCKEGSLPPAH